MASPDWTERWPWPTRTTPGDNASEVRWSLAWSVPKFQRAPGLLELLRWRINVHFPHPRGQSVRLG
jgi:hypothetical protein